MSDLTISIDLDAIDWSEPKRVQTRFGERVLRTAPLPADWWEVWRVHKEKLKAAGYSCSKDPETGEWRIAHWGAIPKEEEEERKQSVEDSMAAGSDFYVPAPEGCEYLPYQLAAAKYAVRRSGTLFGDEMGLGKTIEAICVMNHMLSKGEFESALIVCPASLRINWMRELRKWLVKEFRISVIGIDDWPAKPEIVVINYDRLHRFHEELRKRVWSVLVIDEAHYCKNPKARRTQQIVGRRAWKDQPAVAPIPAHVRLMMTGTPIVNRPKELWPLVHYLDPEYWNHGGHYMRRYCGGGWGPYGYQAEGARNLDELHRRLRESVLVRRLKADVLTELPPKRRQIIVLNANGASKVVRMEREIYERHERDMAEATLARETAETEEDYQRAAKRLQHLRKVMFEEISLVRHEVGLAKVPHVIEHLQNTDGKVVVFAHHKDVLQKIAEEVGEGNYAMVTGDIEIRQRQAQVDLFQQDPSVRFFFGTIGAAGVGLTLTAASHVVFAELDWVPGNVTQAEDRCHRIGQLENVLVQHLVFDQSLDARMVEIIVEKQKIIEQALDKGSLETTRPEEMDGSVLTADVESEFKEKGEVITREQINLVHAGLQFMAQLDPDHARAVNGVGFNKFDGYMGHELASRPALSVKQALYGRKLLKKYWRQIGWDDLVAMGCKPPKEEK